MAENLSSMLHLDLMIIPRVFRGQTVRVPALAADEHQVLTIKQENTFLASILILCNLFHPILGASQLDVSNQQLVRIIRAFHGLI